MTREATNSDCYFLKKKLDSDYKKMMLFSYVQYRTKNMPIT